MQKPEYNNVETDAALVDAPVEVKKLHAPYVYFVLTHVNKKKLVRQYETESKAIDFFKQARKMGVMSAIYRERQGKKERELIEFLQEEGATVVVVDETTGVMSKLESLLGRLRDAVGI
jgi:hypothetical protein